ncbi:hypothetical protein CLOP_g13855 [Closterium sp. NIES-67]|nr:hypothetical protein CLOP_g5900 [Closterium sp. NIES-67]GJP83737.1 hypothetical protein CLOP_g13855 [Closterium sp. NIES-67]
MDERRKIVVCDNGSASIKCGFAGDNFPVAVIPNVVGRRLVRLDETSQGEAPPSILVGSQCMEQQGQGGRRVELSYPIHNGVVQRWDDMGHVWDYTFNTALGIDPKESKILLTDPPLNPTKNRQRMLQMMFEKYNFDSLFIQLQAVLPLYAQGILTGLVVDSGESATHAVPVVEGFAYPHLTKRISIAGRQITSHLIDLMLRRGYSFSKVSDFEAARAIKEQLCFVSCDYKREMQLAEDTTVLVKQFTLPDGRTIRIGAERFQAPEALFSPELIDNEGLGLADVIFRTIQDMDIDHRLSLYQHIMLCGGSTMFPGLPTRLEREVRDRYLKHVLKGNKEGLKKFKLRIEDPPNRKHLVFLGGAVLADIMKDKPDFWISRADYEEEGFKCLRKCENA